MLMKLWNDDCGAIISAELILVLTIAVLALVVGLSELAVAVNTELNDLSNAFGELQQDYKFAGFGSDSCGNKVKNAVAGTTFTDAQDDCDDNLSCDLVEAASNTGTNEN